MPTRRSVSTYNSVGNVDANTAPPTLTSPTTFAGDLLVVAVFWAQGLGASGITTPANLAKVSTDGTSTNRLGAVFVAKVTDPSLFAAGIQLKAGVAGTRVSAVAEAWTPDSGKVWDEASFVCSPLEWNGATMSSDTFPTGIARDLVLGIEMTNKGASTTLTAHTAVGGGTDTQQALAPSAASGSVSDSVVSVTVGGSGVSFNIDQANGQAYTFGASQTASGGGLPAVTGHGFSSVNQMFQTPGATWAHRNLGGTYPEMTEYGVRMAANAGYGVIELSFQRTSDGVWAGSHDSTPDRVAVETTFDGMDFSTLTWAQVSSLSANVGAVGAPKPFATLTQLVQTVPADFVFLLDWKQAGANATYRTEFLDLVDSLLGPSRAIIKIDGALPAAQFQAARARGYKTAAYYYALPATPTNPAAAAANIPYVDLPGLNWDASQSDWDAYLAYGKPLWAHVLTSQANADTARAKGARFIQSTSATIAAVGVSSWAGGGAGSVTDLERAKLAAQTGLASSTSLADLRKAAHPNGEYLWWAGLSGLSPVQRYSLSDHRRKAWSTALSLTDSQAALLSLPDLAARYWAL